MEQACVTPYGRRIGGLEWRPFEPFLRSLFEGADAGIPVDVEATDEELVVRAALPGVGQERLEVTAEEGRLSIVARAAERKEGAESANYVRRELASGEQSRTLRLPRNLDVQRAESSYRDGVLEVRIPRSEASKPHRISIKES